MLSKFTRNMIPAMSARIAMATTTSTSVNQRSCRMRRRLWRRNRRFSKALLMASSTLRADARLAGEPVDANAALSAVQRQPDISAGRCAVGIKPDAAARRRQPFGRGDLQLCGNFGCKAAWWQRGRAECVMLDVDDEHGLGVAQNGGSPRRSDGAG